MASILRIIYWLRSKEKGLALFVTTLGAFIATVQTSALILALPSLLENLNATLDSLLWVLVSFLLVNTTLVPIFGRMADRLKRRKILFNFGLLIFTAFCLILGSAPRPAYDAWDMVGYRIGQGIGASLMFSNSTPIITDLFRHGNLGLAIGVNQIAIAVGFVLGPLIGGGLVVIGWQWIFYINVPLGVIACLLGFSCMIDSKSFSVAVSPTDEKSKSKSKLETNGSTDSQLEITIGKEISVESKNGEVLMETNDQNGEMILESDGREVFVESNGKNIRLHEMDTDTDVIVNVKTNEAIIEQLSTSEKSIIKEIDQKNVVVSSTSEREASIEIDGEPCINNQVVPSNGTNGTNETNGKQKKQLKHKHASNSHANSIKPTTEPSPQFLEKPVSPSKEAVPPPLPSEEFHYFQAKIFTGFDYVGTALFISAMTLLLVLIAEASFSALNNVEIAVLSVVSFVLFVVFFYVESRIIYPVLSVRLFRIRAFLLPIIGGSFAGFSRGLITFSTIFFFQGPYGKDPFQAGLLLIPFGIGLLLLSLLSGAIADRIGFWILCVIGPCIHAGGAIGLTFIDQNTPYIKIASFLTLVGIGAGCFNSPNTKAIMTSVRPQDRGAAASISVMLVNFSMMISITIIFKLILGSVSTQQLIALFVYGGGGLDPTTVSTMVHNYQITMWIAVGLVCISLLITLTYPSAPYFRKREVVDLPK